MATEPAPASPFPVLETPRLVLREITLDDAEFWLRNFSDPDVVELTAYEPPADLEAARGEITRFCVRPFRERTGIRWGIAFRNRPDLIGTLGYHQWVQEGADRARMGYDLLREHRRKGIMTEAMRSVLAYGFDSMGLNRVEALVDPVNRASIRLVEGLGFHRDGTLRENTYFRGRFIDDVVFSLLAREWRSRADANR
jgi:ribosomal-protein-alanine N-acetyltransferase